MFWLLAGLLSVGVGALVAIPLLKLGRTAAAHPDIAVYRDQLAELEREVARGLLPEAEAASARLEIQHRLLAAAAAAETTGTAVRGGRPAVLAAVLVPLLLPAAAVAIYLDLGSPDLPALPFASRAPAAPQNQKLIQLVDRLTARMKAQPEDPKGWILLAQSASKVGRYPESAEAYGQAIARLQAAHAPVAADLHSRYGEALAAADGEVTPAAKSAFGAALAADPWDPRARFYLALGESQAGHLEAALTQWVALEAESPTDAPWRSMLSAEIDLTARKLGRDPATLPGRKLGAAATPPPAASSPAAPGPSADNMARAETMTPEQRMAFIDSMVLGLATRLRQNPDDPDGWLRLANAYDKLGRPDDALAARHEAATRAPDRLDAQLAYVAAGAVRVEQGAPPADFEVTVLRLRKLDPDNPVGLYCAGLIAQSHGDKAGAKRLWQRLLPLMPEGSPQRQQLEAKIALLAR